MAKKYRIKHEGKTFVVYGNISSPNNPNPAYMNMSSHVSRRLALAAVRKYQGK